jgi:hypothetical protein
MKAAIEAMRNKEVDSYRASRVFSLLKQHESVMLKTAREAHLKQ